MRPLSMREAPRPGGAGGPSSGSATVHSPTLNHCTTKTTSTAFMLCHGSWMARQLTYFILSTAYYQQAQCINRPWNCYTQHRGWRQRCRRKLSALALLLDSGTHCHVGLCRSVEFLGTFKRTLKRNSLILPTVKLLLQLQLNIKHIACNMFYLLLNVYARPIVAAMHYPSSQIRSLYKIWRYIKVLIDWF